jgi:hypothetical protein
VKTVNTLLLKQNNEVQPPAFPDVCCYCGDPAYDTIQAEVGEVNLNVPYCEDHFTPASEYINKVIPRFVIVHLIFCVLGGIAFGFGGLLVFEISGLVPQIMVWVVGFVVGFFLTLLGNVGYLSSKWILTRGAKKLGFTGVARIAPGIVEGSAMKEPGSEKVRIELSFADDSYADLFEAKLEATE